MYARTYITPTLGRPGSRRRGLRGLGDATADLTDAGNLIRGGYYVAFASGVANGVALIYDQGTGLNILSAPTFKTTNNLAQAQAYINSGLSLIRDQFGNLLAGTLMSSGFNWSRLAPGSGVPAPVPSAVQTNTPTLVQTPPAGSTTSGSATPTASSSSAPAGDWLSSLMNGTIALPIVGNIPTLYVLGGAAAAIALLVFVSERGGHHARRRER